MFSQSEHTGTLSPHNFLSCFKQMCRHQLQVVVKERTKTKASSLFFLLHHFLLTPHRLFSLQDRITRSAGVEQDLTPPHHHHHHDYRHLCGLMRNLLTAATCPLKTLTVGTRRRTKHEQQGVLADDTSTDVSV